LQLDQKGPGSDCPDLVGRDDKQEQSLILPMQFTAGRGDKNHASPVFLSGLRALRGSTAFFRLIYI
jgi:hypothetical protein